MHKHAALRILPAQSPQDFHTLRFPAIILMQKADKLPTGLRHSAIGINNPISGMLHRQYLQRKLSGKLLQDSKSAVSGAVVNGYKFNIIGNLSGDALQNFTQKKLPLIGADNNR
jgi:hypothetical protein